jgi:asparagine synthase (glutamine-hydrolysing)
MCGIVAIFDGNGAPTLDSVMRGMNTLRHRGPDASHAWESPDRAVGLGHTRLSIIDLTSGDQPLANEDETIHLIVNGEFYDFEEIRADLESRGHHFRTKSDSEILLHLYEEHGVECVHKLRGEYAFVLWDERKKLLFAGRDRFGIKPLFYAERNGRLMLASEVKALHAAGVPAAWDEQGLMATLGMGALDRTLFHGVSSIPPAHYLIAQAGSVTIRQYWDFNYPLEEDLPTGRRDEEYAEEFRGVLEDAVRTRLRADVPVGCYLSGGLDSCSVVALMAKMAPGRVRAFSLSFDHAIYDEGPIAREMAERAGAEFAMIPIRQADIARDLSDAVWHGETMFINGGSAAKFALSRAVRDAGYKVVLTGEGSDEVLAGYPFFRMDLARQAGGADGEAAAERVASTNVASRGLMLATSAVRAPSKVLQKLGYFPSLWEASLSKLDRMSAVLPDGFRPDSICEALLDRLDIAGQLHGRHVVNQSLYLGNKTALPGYILTVLGDRMEMAHSVEGRLPFLDHHVVEYSRKLPISQKIHGAVEKYVLREALKPDLTPTVYARQKHPFLSPPALLKAEEPLHELMQDTLRGSKLARVPGFRRDGVIGMLDNVPKLDDGGKIALEIPLMQILTATLLAERFGL